jgi:acyl homoserine lactone synthase
LNGKNGIKTTTETANFFQDIYNIEKKTGKRVFSEIAKLRTPMIEEEFLKTNKAAANMAELFEGKEAKKVFNNVKIEPFYDEIEKTGLKLFGNILDCWTQFEIFKYSLMAKEEFNKFGNNKYWQNNNLPQAKSELLEDIAQDKRFFIIDGLNVPARLPNAVVLSNLIQFVKGKKWFEMLDSLELSTKGRHFIYYSTTDNKKN